MDYLEKLFKAIYLSPRHLFGLGAMSLTLLFTPPDTLKLFGVETIVSDYRALIGFVAIFSLIFFIIQSVPDVTKKFRHYKSKQQLLNELNFLSKEEKVLLLHCFFNNQKTISLPISHSIANRLKSKGIMIMDIGAGNMTAWAYNIDDYIWQKIQKDHSMLLNGLAEQEMREIDNRIFDRFYN